MSRTEAGWKPGLGAWPERGGVRFRVWAPKAQSLEVVIGEPSAVSHPMQSAGEGFFETSIDGLRAGVLYRYRIDGEGPYPDPASRYQPRGVDGPSQVVDPSAFEWTDGAWRGPDPGDLVLYELHVGTFTPEGTFWAAEKRLEYLRDLGVTVVELMPLADFPGDRNWGYDGAALFAPARCYGTPDDLRRFVDRAHALGLGVFIDVVYNHFGPDGAYAVVFSPQFFSESTGIWGAAMNFDGPDSAHVRHFFIQNALAWLDDYHADGLRLDAIHAIDDRSPRHFLAELTAAVEDNFPAGGRRVLITAEDHRNLAHVVRPRSQEGLGLDLVWSDDFHHEMRRATAGDSDGYFEDFGGTNVELAETIAGGWYFKGQLSRFFGENRGTDPSGTPVDRFVFFIQNHDQVGNRAFGDRLNHAVEDAVYRMATALLLLAPETPLLFMGQEWAAGTPFQYFTDHGKELGRKIARGRREEFARFRAFRDPYMLRRIPDPQARATFERSKLDWNELGAAPHRRVLELYRALLNLRHNHPALKERSRASFRVEPLRDRYLLLSRSAPQRQRLLAAFCLGEGGRMDLDPSGLVRTDPGNEWRLLLDTEEERFAADPRPPRLDGRTIEFFRAGAVVLERNE